ncbi:hypothetical protein NS277_09115 [Novosphingobium barchaimii]|nr:hypothetical protein NS277_09115 [Novosphingobium barchaimii]
MGPVPLAGRLLCAMGADIVRIAKAGSADRPGSSLLLHDRPVVRLDLKSPTDLTTVRDLIDRADGLMEGFRPGVMERLGIGPQRCQARNPALVYVRVTGWGQEGPLAQAAGHDLNYLALSGILHAIGPADRPPPPPLNLIGDYGAGSAMAVIAMLGGLMQVRNGAKGEVIDVAMIDGIAALSTSIHALSKAGRWSEYRDDNMLDGAAPFYRCYSCADGEFIAVGALEPLFFAELVAKLGFEKGRWVQRNRSDWPDMAAAFTERFASQARDEWVALFEGSDACVTPVLSFGEAVSHPHNVARRIFTEGLPSPVPRFHSADGPAMRCGEELAATVLDRWAKTPSGPKCR